jgi:hypothetical protein
MERNSLRERRSAGHRNTGAESPSLILAPWAFLKLQFLLHAEENGTYGFGVSRLEDLLYVEEFIAVARAEVSSGEEQGRSLSEYIEGLAAAWSESPTRFGRIWFSTCVKDSARGRETDERVVERMCRGSGWWVSLRMACSGRMDARLHYACGQRARVPLAVCVDWARWSRLLREGTAPIEAWLRAWTNEYQQHWCAQGSADWSDLDELMARQADLDGENFGRDGIS